MLGNGERGHPELLGLIESLVDAARAFQQRELGVKIQVDEIVHGSEKLLGRTDRIIASSCTSFPVD